MQNNLTLEQQLNHTRFNGGTVTFVFENGSKQIQNLNKDLFINERKKVRSNKKVLTILEDLRHDLKAKSFYL
jgi:uncharacterized alpha/beta hydrolase family protein